MNESILNSFGRNLQALRIKRGLSLSQLAVDAGIAKSNLSRIEQGAGNPTLDTIWRLAIQLDVPFASLVNCINAPISDDGVQVKLIEQGKDNPPVDAYWMSCAPQTERKSEAHSKGTSETVQIISGQLEVETQGNIQTLSAGENFNFAADKPHTYRSKEQWTTLLVTITYQKKDIEHER